MFYYTYLIENNRNNWYIGSTNNLKRRFSEHTSGKVYTTKRLGGKWHLVYYEACLNRNNSKAREKYLNTGMGWRYLKARLKNFRNN